MSDSKIALDAINLSADSLLYGSLEAHYLCDADDFRHSMSPAYNQDLTALELNVLRAVIAHGSLVHAERALTAAIELIAPTEVYEVPPDHWRFVRRVLRARSFIAQVRALCSAADAGGLWAASVFRNFLVYSPACIHWLYDRLVHGEVVARFRHEGFSLTADSFVVLLRQVSGFVEPGASTVFAVTLAGFNSYYSIPALSRANAYASYLRSHPVPSLPQGVK